MSERSPYKEVGLTAHKALRLRDGKKPDGMPGMTKALNATRRPGRRAKKCACGAPKAAGRKWCLRCDGGSFSAPRFTEEKKRWRRDFLTRPR